MEKPIRILLIALLGVGWFSACGEANKPLPVTPKQVERKVSGHQIKPVSVSELRAHQALWVTNSRTRYRFYFQAQISFFAEGPMIVEVDDGKVVKVTDLNADLRPKGLPALEIPTVEQLFEALFKDVEAKHTVRAEFHPILHYPTEVWFGSPETDAGKVYFFWNMQFP